MARRKTRQPRSINKKWYFFVEGCTEENYLKHLKILARESAEIRNCDGGSARNVMNTALKEIPQLNDDNFHGYVIWFDSDRFDQAQDLNLLQSLESKPKVLVYMSKPCMENWLLSHYEKVNLLEISCNPCIKKLNKHIPNYDKNNHKQLEKYIKLENIKSACQNYPDLAPIPKTFKKLKLV